MSDLVDFIKPIKFLPSDAIFTVGDSWVSSAAKGKAAAVRVFELLDRQPPIDSKPWNDDGSPRDVVVPKNADKKGEIEFRYVKLSAQVPHLVLPSNSLPIGMSSSLIRRGKLRGCLMVCRSKSLLAKQPH